MKGEAKASSLCRDAGDWSNPETRTMYEILEWDKDHVSDILERVSFARERDGLSLDDAAGQMAFLLEDDLRSDIRYHFIIGSLWEGVVMDFFDRIDFKELACHYLSKK